MKNSPELDLYKQSLLIAADITVTVLNPNTVNISLLAKAPNIDDIIIIKSPYLNIFDDITISAISLTLIPITTHNRVSNIIKSPLR